MLYLLIKVKNNLKTNTFLKTYHLYQSFSFLWTLFNVVNNEPKKYHVLQIHRICFADRICLLLNWIRINHETMPLNWWQTSTGCNKCATERKKSYPCSTIMIKMYFQKINIFWALKEGLIYFCSSSKISFTVNVLTILTRCLTYLSLSTFLPRTAIKQNVFNQNTCASIWNSIPIHHRHKHTCINWGPLHTSMQKDRIYTL